MIAFRRLVALTIGVVFAPIFVLSLISAQISDLATDPDHMNDMIMASGIIDTAYSEILPEVSQEIAVEGVSMGEIMGTPLTVTFEDTESAGLLISDLFTEIFPQQYTEQIIQSTVESIIRYLNQDTDDFEIDLQLNERVESIGPAFEKAVYELHLVESILNNVLVPIAYENVSSVMSNSLGLKFTEKEFEVYFRRIMPPEWLETHVVDGVNELTIYFSGNSENFNIEIPISSRVDLVGEVLKDKLKKDKNAREVVFTKVIEPLSERMIKSTNTFNYGIAFSREEILEVLKGKASDEWMKTESGRFIDEFVKYMNSEDDSFQYIVDISTLRDSAVDNLLDIASERLDRQIKELPPCSGLVALLTINLKSPDLPKCLPEDPKIRKNVSEGLHMVIDNQVKSFAKKGLPGSFSFEFSDLVGSNPDIENKIKEVKQTVKKGIVFSDNDLREMLVESRSDSMWEHIESIRSGSPIASSDIFESGENIQGIDNIRNQVSKINLLSYLQWVFVPIMFFTCLIGGIGLVGRLKWASGLLIGWVLFFFLFMNILWSYVSPHDLIYELVRTSVDNPDNNSLLLTLFSSSFHESLKDAFSFLKSALLMKSLPWIIISIAIISIIAFIQFNIIEKIGIKKRI